MRIQPQELVERVAAGGAPCRVAVAAAGDLPVLQAVSSAYKAGIAHPVLCGDIEAIDRIARLNNIDISAFEIIETDSDHQAVLIAVSLVRGGRADVLMKGLTPTADVMRAVFSPESGFAGEGLVSHVAAVDCPQVARTLLLTDCAINPTPTLEDKRGIIANAVELARALGVELPKVAAVAAIETVSAKLPATVEAAELVRLNQSGEIPHCVVGGPMALDVAVRADIAEHKGISSEAAGDADILLFHDIEAGNAAYKALTAVAGCPVGGVVVGADKPVVLTSRGDSEQSKLYSLALAAALVKK